MPSKKDSLPKGNCCTRTGGKNMGKGGQGFFVERRGLLTFTIFSGKKSMEEWSGEGEGKGGTTCHGFCSRRGVFSPILGGRKKKQQRKRFREARGKGTDTLLEHIKGRKSQLFSLQQKGKKKGGWEAHHRGGRKLPVSFNNQKRNFLSKSSKNSPLGGGGEGGCIYHKQTESYLPGVLYSRGKKRSRRGRPNLK